MRDALLGRPVRDLDIATHDPPDHVMRLLQDAGIRAIPTGIDHGTVTAVLDEAHFEITTLRLDVETDRRARVTYTDDWQADAARRDFTINALYCDPDGTFYDPFGGLADLKAGRIRFVASAMDRIREDVLRLLRFFRFHAYYGRGPADGEGLAACAALVSLLPGLSGERVAAELLRLLGAPDPGPALALMRETGALDQVLPEAAWPARLAALVAVEDCTDSVDPMRRLAALIAGGAAQADAVALRLRLSGAQRRRLVTLTGSIVYPDPTLSARDRRRLLYRLGRDLGRDLSLLAWADAVAAGTARIEHECDGWRVLADEAARWDAPRFPITGRDVLALGILAGPRVGRILAALERDWIAADFAPARKRLLADLRAGSRPETTPRT